MNTLPHWLIENCTRLKANDEDLVNLNLNIRRFNRIEMMEALAEALNENKTLQILNLTSSLVVPNSLTPLASLVLHNHASLKIIHLSYNKLVDVSALGDAIAENDTLSEIYLNYNLINSKSAIAVAQGLTYNNTLEVLDFNYNNMGDEGAFAFATALGAKNNTLKILGLGHNEISQRGAVALASAMTRNTTIQRLDIQENVGMPRDVCNSILYHAEANRAGRRILRQNGLPIAIWSHIFGRNMMNPTMIYFFLTSRPDLFRS
jgi:Ran GTPase-activating protein (RanGAP) involved in mRNA processing and transport